MAPPPFVVRRFENGEAEALRRLRLLALIATAPPFGVFVGAEPRGLVGFSRLTPANVAHRGTLGAMYVAPELRGSGAAAALVGAVLAHAATCVEQVHLSVNADNLRAARFYRRMGFVEYGREPAGLRYAGIDHDVLLMVRKLSGP
jgi:ribosomal protein S18 acetylase RimI-like enzyme